MVTFVYARVFHSEFQIKLVNTKRKLSDQNKNSRLRICGTLVDHPEFLGQQTGPASR